MLTDDLFIRLINHRISNILSRKEDYLSEVFAWMLINDLALKEALLHANGIIWQGYSIPTTKIDASEINTQVTIGAFGRVDLMLGNAETGILIIENKLDSPYDQEQINRYLDWAHQKKAAVLAIIPQQQLNRMKSTSNNKQFVGIRTWEKIGSFIEDLPPADETRQALRSAFLTLLNGVGIVWKMPEQMQWQQQTTKIQVNEVKNLCRMLDYISSNITNDTIIQNGIPQMYRTSDGVQSFTNKIFYAGKGPAPRPILNQHILLHSRLDGMGNITFSVNFRTYEGTNASVTPGVYLTIFIKPWLEKKNWHNGIISMLEQQGVTICDDINDRIPFLLDNFRDRTKMVLERTKERFLSKYPEWQSNILIYCGNTAINLRIMTTEELLGNPIDTATLEDRYGNLLRDVLLAYFDSNPEQPFARLVADAVFPNWGFH
jgi:hypothetical protein